MNKLFIPALLITLLLIMGLSCEEIDDIVGPKLGEKLIDTTLNVSLSDATVSIEQGVTVTIPKGLTNESFQLIIRAVDKLPETPDIIKLIKVYDIELSVGDQFDKDITIRYDLNPEVFTDKVETDFAFGFYNIKEMKWAIFPDYTINIQQNYVECKTNHLTTVGFLEFVTSGGYAYKFIGDGVTVYYATGDNAPMSWSEYMPSDQAWHLPTSDKNWAPEYIQDIAYYTAEARKIFSQSPHNLNVSKGNINIYVKDLDGSDGEYGSVSGALYLNNKMKLPNHVSGVELEDVLKATCAHELMHFIQDNYYVMNKGAIGMWWLEATATQADRMVWGSSLLYSESEIYSIESNATLLDNLSKSWDDCNKDPNWYLSGCFLQYMSTYRQGAKLNIANSIKAGGKNTLNLMRVILNDQVKSELGTNLMDEYHDYVVYLFTEGNEKLSAFPYNNDFNEIETNASFTKQVKMSKKENTQTVTVALPYLSSKIISVSNLENSQLRVNYNMLERSPGLDVYLCEVDAAGGKLKYVDNLYEGATGDIDLKGRVGGNYDNFVILLINTGFTEGSKEVKFIFKTASDFQEFSFIEFELEGDTGDIKYSNGLEENSFLVGFSPYRGYDTDIYKVVSKSFVGDKINIVLEETRSNKVEFKNYTSIVTVTGQFTAGEFTYINIKEDITKFKEEWSDEKKKWVDHKITEKKEIEYNTIPFNVNNNEYDFVYTHLEYDNKVIKAKLQKATHVITEYNDEDKQIDQYNILPIDWNSVASYFTFKMITSK
jgi:hypothetical protein